MKKFLAIIVVAGFLTACNDGNTNKTETDTLNTTTTVDSVNAVGVDTSAAGATLDTATTRPGVSADTTTAAH